MHFIIQRTAVFVTLFLLILAQFGCNPPSEANADGNAASDAVDSSAEVSDGLGLGDGAETSENAVPGSDGTSPPADGESSDGEPADGAESDGSSDSEVAAASEPFTFDEPAGITYADGLLYVADTNNHVIRTIDLHDNFRVRTFSIAGLKPPSVPPEPSAPKENSPDEGNPGDELQGGSGRSMPDVDDDNPRTAKVRPPVVPGDDLDDLLDPDFPFRARFAWDEIPTNPALPQDPDKWLNTDKPLKISDFKGKFVMLDFWTYCCINCIHILPEIKKLERAYPNQLVVIGVHSAKFEGEKVTSNIREAVLRYEIEHPVVNDVESSVWNRLGVSAWPTIMLIDPEGNLVYARPSEWTFDEMNDVFQTALPYYRKRGLLDEKPIKFPLLKDKENPKPLNFPGKVLADAKSKRLFIADSNNNRIVVSSLDGTLVDVIGTGAIGQDDGGYDVATFNKPQGMALLAETLYVADTENHLIRKIDLGTKTVTTIAGTGVQGRNAWPGTEGLERFAGPPDRYVSTTPKQYAINSPWALYIEGDDLYIAMAGPHQIWKMPLDESEIGPYAGNGREDIVDGPLLPELPYDENYSSFAQPSGLASDGEWLYVADSEGSSIRAVPFDPTKGVKTIIGTSQLPANRLFVFGNRDGDGLLRLTVPRFEWRGRVAQTDGPAMQHCLGVVHHEGKLYVADTYNNSIKMIDLDGNMCTTIAGEKPIVEESAEPPDESEDPAPETPAESGISADDL